VPVARVGPDADDEALASVPPAPAAGHGPEAQLAVVEEVAGLLGVAEVRLHAVARLEPAVVQPERFLVVLDRAAAERARRVLELVADAGRRNVRIALGDAAHRPHAEIGDPATDSGAVLEDPGADPVDVALGPAGADDAHSGEGDVAAGRARLPRHRDAQVLDVAPRPLGRAADGDRARAAERDPVEAEFGAGPGSIPDEVGRGAVEADDVAEVRAVGRVEDPVPVQVFGVGPPVAAGAVRARVAEGVGLLPRLGPTGLVPETEGVEGGPPDLALRDPRLLVEDPESPGPAGGVHPARPPLGVEVVRVLAHGADVDDEGEVTPWRGGGVELEVLAARHVAPGRLEDGRHRAPAAL